MTTTTPTATCASGHTHTSWYAAQSCDRTAAPLPSTQAPLTQAQRLALVFG